VDFKEKCAGGLLTASRAPHMAPFILDNRGLFIFVPTIQSDQGRRRVAHLSKITKGGAASVMMVPTETKGGPAPFKLNLMWLFPLDWTGEAPVAPPKGSESPRIAPSTAF
jgi:hypothetical protein